MFQFPTQDRAGARLRALPAATALVVSMACACAGPVANIAPEDAMFAVQDGAILLDVRSRTEFEMGHLPGAVWVPVAEVADRIEELASLDTPIIVYCLSGHRSDSAVRTLRDAGVGDVHDLGSIMRWPSR